ncbi:hypothetical protein [Streptomyces flavalbus]|uniref:BlaI/MecI/CopY family transcriptional regulator n=1 Tax=Streptomyces flavalbus TaxID=2665155 RepID=A0ABW2WF14_9ACTN
MTSQSAATLRARYVAQAAADLEENRRRQRELAERITALKQEEALLSDIITLAERYEDAADPSRPPEQSQDEPDMPKAGAKTKSRPPLLGDLLTELLAQYEEPRLAKELRDELLQKHPDRNPTPQVVRNTLESLVAKGRVQRHKQQRSVLYTVTPS